MSPLLDSDDLSVAAMSLPGIPGGTPEVDTWPDRREQIVELFKDHIYGHTPECDLEVQTRLIEDHYRLAEGIGTRSQWELIFSNGEDQRVVHVVLYLPNVELAPLVIGLNFGGNHTVENDERIVVSAGIAPHAVAPDGSSTRGTAASSWPYPLILEQGFGLITVWAGDFEPDRPDAQDQGIRGLLPPMSVANPWGSFGVGAFPSASVGCRTA